MTHILVADDSETNRNLVTAIFHAEGIDVITTCDGEGAIAEVSSSIPSAILLDVRMPGMGGMAALDRIKKVAPEVPVIMLTAHGDIAMAVEATKRGAYDFLIRPIENDQLVLAVRRALEHNELEDQVKGLRRRLAAGGMLARLTGGEAMRRVVEQIEQVANTNMTVLVQGETGTGKELVARAIHQESARRSKPFIPLDCGAIPDNLVESELFGHEKGAFTSAERRKEGHFVLADGGTLFFDEVGNLPLPAQAKVLRAIQERQAHPVGAPRAQAVDVRFVAATNERLDASVAAGRFREDLYYRIAEFTITIPPLRDRRDDVARLAASFQEEASAELQRPVGGLDARAIELLEAYPWPGNVRQLRNVVRRAVLGARGPTIGGDDIMPLLAKRNSNAPARATTHATLGKMSLKEVAEAASAEAEREAIRAALQATHGNKTGAARLLGVDFKTLHVKMKRLGLTRE